MSNIHQLDPHDPHAIAQEVAMELDREYFRVHPDETHYTRAHVPHEYPAQVYTGGEVVAVVVHHFAPGLRARVPLQRAKIVLVNDIRSEQVLTSDMSTCPPI